MRYTLVAAMTLDGKIAQNAQPFSNWTSKEDRDHLHKIEDQCDVLVVGHNTYKAAQEPLSKRNCIVLTRSVKKTKRVSKSCLFYNPKSLPIEKLLRSFGYKYICILGGTQTYNFFLHHGLIDEIYLTIEPYIFGRGLCLFDFAKDSMIHYTLFSIKKLNNTGTILLHYKK